MCDYFTAENSHPTKLFTAQISHHTYIFVISGSSAMADILPVSSTLQFVTNMTQQDIVLSVLPDDIPEVAEVSRKTGNMGHYCDSPLPLPLPRTMPNLLYCTMQ